MTRDELSVVMRQMYASNRDFLMTGEFDICYGVACRNDIWLGIERPIITPAGLSEPQQMELSIRLIARAGQATGIVQVSRTWVASKCPECGEACSELVCPLCNTNLLQSNGSQLEIATMGAVIVPQHGCVDVVVDVVRDGVPVPMDTSCKVLTVDYWVPGAVGFVEYLYNLSPLMAAFGRPIDASNMDTMLVTTGKMAVGESNPEYIDPDFIELVREMTFERRSMALLN